MCQYFEISMYCKKLPFALQTIFFSQLQLGNPPPPPPPIKNNGPSLKCFKAIYMFIFYKFEIFSDIHPGTIGQTFREKLLIKLQNQNIFEKFKLNRNLQTIPLKMMYMTMLRHRFSNERGRGGGFRRPEPP